MFVTYSTTGNFGWSAQFRAELSNNLGFFTNPITIGSSNFNLGIIPAQIPLNVGLGIYRIRVVSENPYVVGTPSPTPLVISNIPQATQIIVFPDDTVCYGDSIRLMVAPVFSQVEWSTGNLGNTIYVHSSGIYSVETTDIAGCKGYDTVKVHFLPCSSVANRHLQHETKTSSVFPNPAKDKLYIKTPVSTSFQIILTDFNGRILMKTAGNSGFLDLDIEHLEAGCYFLNLQAHEITPEMVRFCKIH
ncbi:MAG: T9SS type A sorting domain-containing protein [Flavobacteriales bacterium]|nr:T9SS type A sorting domain-containing protein [Flavobacteriales bacterium]